MPRPKSDKVMLSVFKGQEAKLNRGIFWAFKDQESLTTRVLHKKIMKIRDLKETSYSTVNKRVRNLEQTGYLKKSKVNQRVGGITNYYVLTPKAQLAILLSKHTIEDLFEHINNKTAKTILKTLKGIKK